MKNTKIKTVDEYFADVPLRVRRILKEVRKTIKVAAPEAEEVISYSMPAFKLNGILVWYGAHKEHIGLYPKTKAIEVFKKELAAYKCSKGAIQFPIDKPMPFGLIAKIVKFRVRENAKMVKRQT